MSSLLKSVRNLVILGFFDVGIVVAAASFGLFGCTCAEQNRVDPPVHQQRKEPAWSTSQGGGK